MAEDFRSNLYFRGAQWRYVRLIVTALIVLAVLSVLAARVRPALTYKYVSMINQGHLQVCRVTPDGVACPPLSVSPSKSNSVSKSKSDSLSKSVSPTTGLKPPSKSTSTSTSLLPPSRSVSTSTSLSPSVRTH